MRSAAQRQGATLLLDQPRQLGFAPLCSATQDSALPAGGYCVRVPQSGIGARGQLGDVYQLLDHEGKRRIAVTIGEAHSWARLAKRGESANPSRNISASRPSSSVRLSGGPGH